MDIFECGSFRVTEDTLKDEKYGREKLHEQFPDKETGATSSITVEFILGVARKAEKGVVRRCAVCEFNAGGVKFYPCFRKTEGVRMVGVHEI